MTLSALIAFEEPLEELRAALAAFHRRSDPIITVFTCGEIDGRTVEAWADAIEFREDIQLESGHEDVVASAVHDLANPALQGKLNSIASDLAAT
ncbi:hypothetical protein GOC72_22255 [Sinorhizobium medicae]|uniref:hypothetical protein n=1 Tax=Sinorhizobium medicae TaxID=110321 RepID=UPI00048758BB|nr:hypothetical protein [Sinorhizobium medicae]MDX0456168.1 hypothetical protein [Sinorhizobium medicae]MDX0905964.1 hypothetical protein [Sinorhizobium medicae]PLU41327.1 hypothetical protein BMJ26_07345 [Sinorhizobium medicae]